MVAGGLTKREFAGSPLDEFAKERNASHGCGDGDAEPRPPAVPKRGLGSVHWLAGVSHLGIKATGATS